MSHSAITQQQQPTQAELREQIREQVRKSVEDARAQVQAAQKQLEKAQDVQTSVKVERVVTPAPTPPLPPLPPMQGTPVIVETPEHYIGMPSERLDDIPPRAQELGMMFFATMALIIIGFPIARAIGRFIDRKSAAPALRDADLQPQLLRIEQAVEAMSIEIERISESQRYLTRLQSGREELLVPRRSNE